MTHSFPTRRSSDLVIIYNRTEPEDIKLSRTGRFRYGNGSLRYGSLRWMLFACSVVIQTALLALTLLLTLLGLNYSHEPLTGSNLASVLIVWMFAAMTWYFQFRLDRKITSMISSH